MSKRQCRAPSVVLLDKDVVTRGRHAQLQSIVAWEAAGRLGCKIGVLFSDVTTLSYASQKAGDLHKTGYSKDGMPP